MTKSLLIAAIAAFALTACGKKEEPKKAPQPEKKVEAPKAEAPKAEAPKAEAPKAEEKKDEPKK